MKLSKCKKNKKNKNKQNNPKNKQANKQTDKTLQGHVKTFTRVHLSTLQRNLITFLNYISISVI
jgi:hypothetical protein